jgi:hypothetical protein
VNEDELNSGFIKSSGKCVRYDEIAIASANI